MSRFAAVEPLTWALLVAAVGVGTWAHLDADGDTGPSATLVSTRSAAWRVLPELANTDAAGATIELHPASGPTVYFEPDGLAHRLVVGKQIMGPADPEAVAGVWDSLRMATTLRAVDGDAVTGLGDGGRVVITLPQGGERTVVLGLPTADGAGLYGAIEGGAEGTEGVWVLEQELRTLVDQAPQTWLARRTVVAEPSDVVALSMGPVVLRRGLDGHWRGRVGEGPPAMLDRVAVETRLDRLVSSRLDPMLDPREDEGEPWVSVEGADGHDFHLRTHGPCPGRPERVLVDRGPGQWGCVDAVIAQPWPVPGATAQPVGDGGSLLDPRLVPHRYGRVLQIEQRLPEPQVLARHAGAWRIEQVRDGRTTVFDVGESEAYRWYQALHDAEVAVDPAQDTWPETSAVDLRFTTDSTVTLRLRCTDETPTRCRRDEGPVLTLRSVVPALAFDVDTFAERRLVSLPTEDVRALEILPTSATAPTVRQSAHFDLGVWRLDAPTHPLGDAALDELALQAMLAAVSTLRAEAWVEDAERFAPMRTLRIERTPRRDQAPVVQLELREDCVAVIDGQRAARLSPGACASVMDDLLVDLPLDRALLGARGLALTVDSATTTVRRNGEIWRGEDDGPAAEVNAWITEHASLRADGIEPNDPQSVPIWSLRVLPTEGTPYTFEGGPGWLRIRGADWRYRLDGEDDESDSLTVDAED